MSCQLSVYPTMAGLRRKGPSSGCRYIFAFLLFRLVSKAFCKTWFRILHRRGQTQACTVSKFDLGSWSGHDAASQPAAAKHGASFKASVACLDVKMHVCFRHVQAATLKIVRHQVVFGARGLHSVHVCIR